MKYKVRDVKAKHFLFRLFANFNDVLLAFTKMMHL